MVQRQFLEFKEESGIGDLLFVNISQPTKYRFYCRRDSWDDYARCPGSGEHFFKLKHKEKFICIYNDGEVYASSLL